MGITSLTPHCPLRRPQIAPVCTAFLLFLWSSRLLIFTRFHLDNMLGWGRWWPGWGQPTEMPLHSDSHLTSQAQSSGQAVPCPSLGSICRGCQQSPYECGWFRAESPFFLTPSLVLVAMALHWKPSYKSGLCWVRTPYVLNSVLTLLKVHH